jgi:hypothetical protein
MFGVMNPWLLVGLLIALTAATGTGYKLGSDSVKAQLYAQQEAAEADRKQLQKAANTYAFQYEQTRQDAETTAHNLRRELNAKRNQLASCDGRFALLNAEFIRLRNAALQAKGGDTAEPADAATGTVTPEELIEFEIENGKRWKQCRDQLTALIEVVK